MGAGDSIAAVYVPTTGDDIIKGRQPGNALTTLFEKTVHEAAIAPLAKEAVVPDSKNEYPTVYEDISANDTIPSVELKAYLEEQSPDNVRDVDAVDELLTINWHTPYGGLSDRETTMESGSGRSISKL